MKDLLVILIPTVVGRRISRFLLPH